MNKIASDHLSRQAFVYVRQSSRDQLRHNHESRRRQYGLAERARRLGWTDPVVVDDDLGRSGGGSVRPGFERLLLAICEGRVGIVLAVEASRLARNGRDWHTLLEFCGLVSCLLADEEAVYDPRLPDDRLLLGMKGTFSEMELSLLRQRSLEALRQKARHGELFLNVAVGYVKVRHDRIAKDPDLRVQEAIGLVFRKFAEFESIRQVHLWLRQEDVRLPSVEINDAGRRVEWKLPVYKTVHRLLTNPIYGGAYAFGRTGSRVTVENGRKRVRRGLAREREQWDVLIVDHHEGYVSWAEYERNQRVIADNAARYGRLTRGAVRRGEGLLAGLLRCGHCGRRVHVAYSGTKGKCVRYSCRGARLNHGTKNWCIAFGGMRVDAAVATEVLRLLRPLGIEAALERADRARRTVDRPDGPLLVVIRRLGVAHRHVQRLAAVGPLLGHYLVAAAAGASGAQRSVPLECQLGHRLAAFFARVGDRVAHVPARPLHDQPARVRPFADADRVAGSGDAEDSGQVLDIVEVRSPPREHLHRQQVLGRGPGNDEPGAVVDRLRADVVAARHELCRSEVEPPLVESVALADGSRRREDIVLGFVDAHVDVLRRAVPAVAGDHGAAADQVDVAPHAARLERYGQLIEKLSDQGVIQGSRHVSLRPGRRGRGRLRVRRAERTPPARTPRSRCSRDGW